MIAPMPLFPLSCRHKPPSPNRSSIRIGSWPLKHYSIVAAMALIASLMCATVLTCVRMENPYLDRTKCRITITGPYKSGDTLNIFSAQQFTVDLLLQAHIVSFSFSADSNYLGTGGDSILEHGSFGNAYSFPFTVAFWDTGWKTLRAIATLDDGTIIGDSMQLYCVSPLNQRDIISDVGKLVALTTAPVAERLSIYIWKLTASDSVWNYEPSQTWYMNRTISGTGELYVRLLGKNIRSPGKLFKISVADQTPPLISCLNTNAFGNERNHVSASAPPFFLQLEIRDQASSLKQALADGAPLSRIDTLDEKTWKCVKEISVLPAPGESLSVTVWATDAAGNAATKTFWVHYDSAAVVRPSLVITEPATDSVVVSRRFVSVRGAASEIEGYDTLFVFLVGSDSTPRIIMPLRPQWQWTCPLGADTTTLRFCLAAPLVGNRFDTLDIAEITVIFNPMALDTVPPSIDTVYSGTTAVHNGYQASGSPLRLTVRPFDQSGIASVTIGGQNAFYEGNNSWSADVALIHQPIGNSVRFVAVDSSGNAGEVVRLIYLNNSPRITRMPRNTYATVGIAYVDTVSATDADGDSLTLSVRIFASSGTVVRHCDAWGVFSWTPTAADTGQTDVLVQVSDGYPAVVDSAYRIMVRAATQAMRKARFITTAADFPETLTVGNQWICTLSIDMPPESGRYVFTAQLTKSGAYLLNQTTDSVIRWTPVLQDTGMQTLRVIVYSSSDSADSIIPQPRFTVAAPQLWSVRFSSSSSSASEAVGTHTIGVELNRPSDGTVSIGYAVQWGGGTSADSTDFRLAVPRRLVFPAGVSTAVIPIAIVDDTLPEVTEYVTLKLVDPLPTTMALRIPSTHQVAILDNDSVGLADTIAITTADGFEPEMPTNVAVRIEATSPMRKDAQLRIALTGNAQQGNHLDYTVNPIEFTMRRGERHATVTITINDDALCEPVTEFITLTLRTATPNVTITDSQCSYAILPNDSAYCNRTLAFLYRQKPMSSFEKAMVDTISKMGYSVYPLARDEIRHANLCFFTAVAVSASMADVKLGDSLAQLPVPIICCSPEVSVGLGLVSGSPKDSGAEVGLSVEVSADTRMWVRLPITTVAAYIPWIHPAILGQIVARIPKSNFGVSPVDNGPQRGIDTLRAAVFHGEAPIAYESYYVPVRRTAFSVCRPTAGSILEYTPGWWALLKSSVEWTAYGRVQQSWPLQKKK